MSRWSLVAVVVALCSSVPVQAEGVASIGAPIRQETARAWTRSFEEGRPGAAPGHLYGRKALKELLSLEGVAGLYIFKGLDDRGAEHLFFKAADAEGQVIHPDVVVQNGLPCPPSCPKADIAAIGGRVDRALAARAIQRYEARAARTVRGHLYGRDVFERLFAQQGVEGLYFAFGLGEDGSEHLVLAGVDGTGRVLWEGLVVNQGLSCPPTCPKPEE